MSATMMQEVLRISDRFHGVGDSESMERQQRLYNCVIVVAICHVIMLIACWKMHDYERVHPRIISDVEVQFEIDPPPPIDLPKPKIVIIPADIRLDKVGDNPNAGEGGSIAAPVDETRPEKEEIKGEEEKQRPTPSYKATPKAQTLPLLTLKPQGNLATKQAEKLPTPEDKKPVSIASVPSDKSIGNPDAPSATPNGNDGLQNAGKGEGDKGKGLGREGDGTEKGTQGGIKLLDAKAEAGNIAPYRKRLLLKLAQTWSRNATNSTEHIFVLITIAPNGSLIKSEVESDAEIKGRREKKEFEKGAEAALKAVDETEFEPLPEWFRGKSLTFRINLSNVNQTVQQH